MEKERKIKVLSIIALLIAVVGLTVAFAAMSKTLTINGTATMEAAKWDVRFKFDEESGIEKTGGARLCATNANECTIENETLNPSDFIDENGTSISNINIVLTKPGDSVTFRFKVVNEGDVDAKYSDLLINGKSWFDFAANYDANLNYVYANADWDGDGQTTFAEREKTLNIGIMPGFAISDLNQNDILKAPGEGVSETETYRDVILQIEYPEEATEQPKGEFNMNIDFSAIFEQA